ncbi:alpha-mannosidase [bacterium]|nr:alpha-mannosidase [bacterium]
MIRLETIREKIRSLQPFIVLDKIEPWQARLAYYEAPGKYKFLEEKEIKLGDVWGNPGDTVFLRTKISLPDRDDLALELVLGGEALVRLNGEAYQGLDNNRRIVPLPKLKEAEIEIEAYNPPAHSYRSAGPLTLKSSFLVALNRDVYDYYFDLISFLEIIENEADPLIRGTLLSAIERSFKEEDPKKARELLWQNIDLPKPAGEIHLLGQSHIDIAWLWPLKETVRKCGRTFATIINLMREFPEFRYVQSEPQAYEFAKEQFPEVYEKIKEMVKAGKWEVVGGMWLEPDCNIPSGESFVRQLLYGKRFFMKEFGIETNIEWLPDVFGFSAALPQILKKAGMDYFMTIKIFWNDTNRFPYTHFLWKGIDGTCIETFFPRALNQDINAREMKEAWNYLQQGGPTPRIAYLYGYGDGGGGPTREQIEKGRRFSKLPGLPACKFSTAKDFFSQIGGKKDLPVWDDELYLEYHRGTLTTQARNKRWNRKSEFLLRDAEFLAFFAGKYPKEKFDRAWKLVLLNQFHDILPGSSIGEVYVDSKKDYEEIFAIGEEIKKESLSLLAKRINTKGEGKEAVIVFNSLSWDRKSLVEVELPEGLVVDAPCQRSGNKLLFIAEVPSMGYRTYQVIEGSPSEGGLTVKENHLENDMFSLDIDDEGRITRLIDKRNKKEVLAGPGNEFFLFHDLGNAWEVEKDYEVKFWKIGKAKKTIVESGPVRGILRLEWEFGDSKMVQDLTIYRDIPRIDFVTYVDWHEKHKLLKVAFPVNVRARFATYNIAYGNLQRPTHRNTSWEQARYEVSGHKWADLSDSGYGVSLMNDCKYGYDIRDNVMRLSLLRAPTAPDPDADQGEHHFTYSLFPHTAGLAPTIEWSYDLNVPLIAWREGAHQGELPELYSFARAEGVIIEALKRAEDDDALIIRCYEPLGQSTKARIKLASEIKKAVECDLLERPIGDVQVQGDTLLFDVHQFEIKTFKIDL